MNGGMRIDPKNYRCAIRSSWLRRSWRSLPRRRLWRSGKKKHIRNIQPVRRLVFASDEAARRYRILRKQAESGMICELLLHKNEHGLIDCFTYTITEEY